MRSWWQEYNALMSSVLASASTIFGDRPQPWFEPSGAHEHQCPVIVEEFRCADQTLESTVGGETPLVKQDVLFRWKLCCGAQRADVLLGLLAIGALVGVGLCR